MTPHPLLYKNGELVLHIPTQELRRITAVIPDARHGNAYPLAPAPEGTTPIWATDREITDP